MVEAATTQAAAMTAVVALAPPAVTTARETSCKLSNPAKNRQTSASAGFSVFENSKHLSSALFAGQN
jgi:hypothetical protein